MATVKQTGDGYVMYLSKNDTEKWAKRPGKVWPCSELRGKTVSVEVDSNGIFGLRVNGSDGADVDGNELDAIVSDHLPLPLQRYWPTWKSNEDIAAELEKRKAETDRKNAETSKREVEEFIRDKPDKYFAYVKLCIEPAIVTGGLRGEIITWMGDKLGDLVTGQQYHDNFGGCRVPIIVQGINGVEYYGTYYRSAGNYCRIYKRKPKLERMDINKILGQPAYKADGPRGASLGRINLVGEPTALYLQRVRFNGGNAFDPGGAYWGAPANLWCAFDRDLNTMVFVRAGTRLAARTYVREAIEKSSLGSWRGFSFASMQ